RYEHALLSGRGAAPDRGRSSASAAPARSWTGLILRQALGPGPQGARRTLQARRVAAAAARRQGRLRGLPPRRQACIRATHDGGRRQGSSLARALGFLAEGRRGLTAAPYRGDDFAQAPAAAKVRRLDRGGDEDAARLRGGGR